MAGDDKNDDFIHGTILELNAFVFEIHAYRIALAPGVGTLEHHGYGTDGLTGRPAMQVKLHGGAAGFGEQGVELISRFRNLSLLLGRDSHGHRQTVGVCLPLLAVLKSTFISGWR